MPTTNTDKAALLKQTIQKLSMIRTLILIQKIPRKSMNDWKLPMVNQVTNLCSSKLHKNALGRN